MNEHAAMRALIRKDTRILLPLVSIGVIGCLAFNLLHFLLWQYWDLNTNSLYQGSVMIWGLMPGLVAFGVASMLIGTEQDSGTLAWLRTLPISWRQIAVSKLTAGFGAFATVWIVATLIFWLFSHAWDGDGRPSDHLILTISNFASILLFQLLLLVLGYVVAYWIRMPLAGLIALIPAYVIVTSGLAIVLQVLDPQEPGPLSPVGLFAGGGLLLLVLGMTQHALAYRRLTRPEGRRMGGNHDNLANTQNYRPPTLGLSARPSRTSALLWQQFRQTAPACAALLLISILLVVLYFVHRREFLPVGRNGDVVGVSGIITVIGAVAPLFVILNASWLGAMTFYADNQKHRHDFFADRGISPTTVWWTRLVPPLICCAVLVGCIVALGAIVNSVAPQRGAGIWQSDLHLIALVTVMFAFGQLVSQWIDQPILCFLAAPAYTFVALSYNLYLIDSYVIPFQSLMLTAPVLLFASWRLSRPWLEGRNKAGYTLRVFGYTAIAIALPFLFDLGARLIHAVLLM